jgi:hypothetical protein
MYKNVTDERILQSIQYKVDELREKLDADTLQRLVWDAQELLYRANVRAELFDEENEE